MIWIVMQYMTQEEKTFEIKQETTHLRPKTMTQVEDIFQRKGKPWVKKKEAYQRNKLLTF